MQKLCLANSKLVALVDDEDFDLCSRHIWYLAKRRNIRYARARISNQNVFLHQLILPSDNPNLTPDHKNGNGLDNQKNNLRLATGSQQIANQEKRQFEFCSSKYKGVCFRKDTNKWTVGIKINYKRINLGCFDSEIEAAKAYNRAARKYFGEFANLNTIESEAIQ
jgi:hypothetical protein